MSLNSLFNELPFTSMTDGSSSATVLPRDRWGKVSTSVQEREDRLSLSATTAKWSKIYRLFGATTEDSRDEVFVAVNGYFAVNGCSPDGRYARDIRTGGGVAVSSSDVVRITGKLEGDVRQFLRGKLKESFESLKNSTVLTEDEATLAKAESLGIPRHMVYLVADWLKGCEYFSVDEAEVYIAVSRKTIQAAAARRAEVGSNTGRRADLGSEDDVSAVVPPVVRAAVGPSY